MKKLMLMATDIILSVTTVFAADLRHGKMTTDTTKKAKPAKVQYTCTMHPEVLSDKPGKCPKCGMTLVKKEEKKKSTEKTKM